MDLMWLESTCHCILFIATIVVSVRLCMAVRGSGSLTNVQEGTQGARPQPGSVSYCLRLCLGLMGVVGGAIGVPVVVLLNLRTAQCLYTCITIVCCPLLVKQFTMFLLMLLTLDEYLHHRLADRYYTVVTRQRALCVVLLCWVGSVLSSFAQFIGSDVLDTWRSTGRGPETADHGLDNNETTLLPNVTPFPTPKYLRDRMVIGTYLPYGGFLSKFYVTDMRNFTYAEIHSSHWGVCGTDTLLSSQFLVYVHGMTAFMLPLLLLLAIYLHLICIKPRKTDFSHTDPPKHDSCLARSLALSLSLLILLCLPVHIIHALMLFTPTTHLPSWVHTVAVFLFELYGLVPQILFTPPRKKVKEERASFPVAVRNLPPAVAQSVRMALCQAVHAAPWYSAKHSLKAKVFPEV
ncbi:adenosine receptor A1-like [Acanthochromis polyacanthus]|uniref:adenosine receptor A1-like n=1 Tax=Acanthochromis polyacanthus TaxID=80966 RepID=UPI002234C047|nr:adenosine receptor A1-like [Acanthochromis polyacanthus]